MTVPGPTPPDVRAHLNRILTSTMFRSSKRSQDFLRLVVERTLAGQVEELKERAIGVELFGREPDYDTHEDAIVRVKANEIRKRLAQYYQSEGAQDHVRIELPTGSYQPDFQVVAALDSSLAGSQTSPPENQSGNGSKRRLAAAVVAVLVLVAAWWWVLRPASPVERFWAPMLAGNQPILFHMGQSVVYQFSRRIHDDYLRANPDLLRSMKVYSIPLDGKRTLEPGDIVALHDLSVSTGDATAIANIGSVLRERGREFQVKFGGVNPGEGSATLAVLVGAFNNPWTLAATRDLRFYYSRELSPRGASWSIRDRETGKAWQLWDVHPVQNAAMDYALITRLVDPQSKTMTLAIGGITQFGTEAASLILTSSRGIEQVAALSPEGWDTRNMQILIHTGVVGRAAVNPEVLAVHVW